MNRRDIILKSGAAMAGIALGAANSSNNKIYAKYNSNAANPRRFGLHENEVIVPTNTDPKIFANSGFDSLKNLNNYSSATGNLKKIRPLTPEEIGDQFFVFQLTPVKKGKWFVKSPQDIKPTLETSEKFPDVVLDSRLVSFHIGESERLERDTKATVRITFGSDQNTFRARDMGENLFWAITSGINLWNSRGMKARPKDFTSDFRKVFGNKYVELPGGSGTIKVEIVQHKKSSWWEKVFDFSQSSSGRSLISALGFPGVTSNVIKFVDDAANKFVGDNARVLFSSRGLPIAFTKQSQAEISATGTRIGSLKTGVWIFARGRDLPLLAAQEMTYDATLRRLFPAAKNIVDIISGKTPDPLRKVTYAIMNSRLKKRKINVGF